MRGEVGAAPRKEHDERLRRELHKADLRTRDASELQLQELRGQLAQREETARQALKTEPALRRRARELEDRQQEMDLEIQRRLDAERARVEDRLRRRMDRERRAMERLWKEREKQIERITLSTVGMYGELRAIIGATLPAIEALELEPPSRLSGDSD